jgi:hypothetical protein
MFVPWGQYVHNEIVYCRSTISVYMYVIRKDSVTSCNRYVQDTVF